MKFTTLLFILFCSSAMLFANDKTEEAGGEGIQFFEGSWKETLAESKRTGKLIFIDAYTSWCGPCKKMAKQIFPLKEVGDFYNKNFVNAKFDMEKGDGRKVRQEYNVNAFPTFLFVDGDGKLHFKSKGGKPADRFIQMGKTALSKVDYSGQYAEKYEEGDRDPELLYNYAYSLMKSNKSSVKIANEYLQTQKDLSSEKNLNFILDLATESDSRIFGLLIKNRAKLEQLRSAALVRDKIEAACWKTVDKAVEFNSGGLLAEAKMSMKKHYPDKATTFAAESDIKFAQGVKNGPLYTKACDKYLKKIAKNNSAEHNRLAKEAISAFADNKAVMAKVEKWAAKAAKYGGLYDYQLTYARALLKNGKSDAAKKALQLAIDLGKKQNKNTKDAEGMLKKLG